MEIRGIMMMKMKMTQASGITTTNGNQSEFNKTSTTATTKNLWNR